MSKHYIIIHNINKQTNKHYWQQLFCTVVQLSSDHLKVCSLIILNMFFLCPCVCRCLNTSGETQRSETLFLPEQPPESQLLLERQSVKTHHRHRSSCALTSAPSLQLDAVHVCFFVVGVAPAAGVWLKVLNPLTQKEKQSVFVSVVRCSFKQYKWYKSPSSAVQPCSILPF